MRSGEVHQHLLALYQGLGAQGKSWQVPGLKTLRDRFVSPVKPLVKVGPGNYSNRIQKSFLPSIAMDVAPRGSFYTTIKELGPKISYYRRNYGPNSLMVVYVEPLGSSCVGRRLITEPFLGPSKEALGLYALNSMYPGRRTQSELANIRPKPSELHPKH